MRAAALLFLACGSGGTRDVVPDSRDVTSKPDSSSGYIYVSKRAMGAVMLSQADGLDEKEAQRATDKLADALDACSRDQTQKGRFTPGAVRLGAEIDEGGVLGPPHVVLSPGGGGQANALLCVVAPFRMLQFSSRDADASSRRRFAIDATWGG